MENSVSSHEGKKPFKCDICSSSFARKSNLKVVHGGKKPFECDTCSDTFSQKDSWEKEAILIGGTNLRLLFHRN